MQKGILKKYFERDNRIVEVFRLARSVYDGKNLPSHNMNHIAQVIYRALLIGETDKLKFNPAILIPACILHDIGYSIVAKKEGHEEAGIEISKKLLTQSGFTDEEINKIIEAFVDYRIFGKSIEADILYDADVLDQAGYASMNSFFVSLYEYQQFPDGKEDKYKLENFLQSRKQIVTELERNGLRTIYGKKLLKDGFAERRDFIEKALESINERPDFLVSPDELF